MSCFVFGSKRQLQQLLEEERCRHAEAENQWKEEKRKLTDAAASAFLKAQEERQTAPKSEVRLVDNMGGSQQQKLRSDLVLFDGEKHHPVRSLTDLDGCQGAGQITAADQQRSIYSTPNVVSQQLSTRVDQMSQEATSSKYMKEIEGPSDLGVKSGKSQNPNYDFVKDRIKEPPPTPGVIPDLSLLNKLQIQIKNGFKRRKDEDVRATFDLHKQGKFITESSLRAALKDLGIDVLEEDVGEMLKTSDMNADGGLDFDEFSLLVARSSPGLEFFRSLPLAELVLDGLPKMEGHVAANGAGEVELRHLCSISRNELETSIQAIAEGLRTMLQESLAALKRAYDLLDSNAAAGNAAAAKFQIIKMSVGTIRDFHAGIAARIGGGPHLEFEKAMGMEHCAGKGCREYFVTNNYKIRTCPIDEWQLTVLHDLSKATSPEATAHSRRFVPIAELEKVDVAMQAELTRPEVIAVVLYTGPMFVCYNAVPRRFPTELCERMGSFATTIFVLISAVQKVARVMKLPEGLRLYRGMGGLMDLPQEFFHSDLQGRKGFVEWGFMSTTSDLKVAMQYSGAAEGRPLPLVLQVAVGAADRGACIRELSQYQQEVEYLFVPCSFLAPDGPPLFRISDGGLGVRVVPVRISTSHSARTVEDLLGEKKRIHATAFRYLVDETRDVLARIAERGGDGESSLGEAQAPGGGAAAKRLARDVTGAQAGPNPVARLLETIVGQCEERLRSHEAVDPRDYADNRVSQRLAEEMLYTRRWAVSKLRLWLEDPTEFIIYVVDYPLRHCHRLLTKFLSQSASKAVTAEDQRAAALAVCVARGKVIAWIDEVNDMGEDPLVAAAADGAAASDIRMIVAAGAAVNGADGASPALINAAQNGYVGVIAALLEAKAAVNAPRQMLNAGRWA